MTRTNSGPAVRTPAVSVISALTLALALSIAACSGKKSEAPARPRAEEVQVSSDRAAGSGTEAARPASSGDWRDAFRFVRDAIRTEPSPFPLKTPSGVEWSRSANPLEKALYLARLLLGQGRTVEIVEGELDDATARRLLTAIFAPAESFSIDPSAPVSVPSEEPDLVASVKRHFWVRLEGDDAWVDLDPAFPDAEPGQSFAEATERYDPADEELGTRLRFALDWSSSPSSEAETVLEWEGGFDEAANKSVSLAIRGRFEETKGVEEAEESGGGIGGLFGGLSGRAPSEKKAAPGVKAFYPAVLTIDGDEVADGEIEPGDEPVGLITLRIEVESLGRTVSSSRRVLFEADGGSGEPPLFQRHAILVTGDRIPAAAWQGDLAAVSDEGLLADVRAKVEGLKKDLEDEKVDEEAMEGGVALEARVGPAVGHVVNMIFASTSDERTAAEAEALSVAWWYRVPRILITSFSGTEGASETVIDLRQDRVEAVALPGQVRGIRQAFHYGRGVVESALEGRLLEVFTGKPALSTAALIKEAARADIPIRMFSSLERDGLVDLGVPEPVLARMDPALEAGRIIVVPERAVAWDGRDRWGWWDMDPATMETVGVLDSGLHQAMVQRTVLETEGPMQSRMGAVLGAMVGAIDTYWLLSAMIIKHGGLSKAALEEAKAYMKNIQAVMCPEFERKVGFSVSVTLIDIEDCFRKEIELVGAEGGVKISQGWCEQFAKGFACASTSIINYYLSQAEE